MMLRGLFGKNKKRRFECVYDECKSLCCKTNLVVLNEADVAAFQEMNINLDDVTRKLELNKFLEILGSSSIKQLEGLEVLRLKKDEAGNCVFLNLEKGVCEIYEKRPYYCREFPFKFSKGKIKRSDPICPGLERGEEKGLAELKKDLGLDVVELKPPQLVGDEKKLKTSRSLMSVVFRLMK
jgi:Fe-S-cluster containining protein